MKVISETERLILRELSYDDLPALCAMMEDEETMKAAYVRPFTIDEVRAWISRHLARYEKFGFGLWAVVLKETGEVIGQCGITLQDWKGREVFEIGYLLNKAFGGKGYATEAAIACKQYAFDILGAEEVSSHIRDTHTASQNVALRIGMKHEETDVKNFRGIDMTFYRFVARK